jgi:hypothetical protein
MRPKVEYGKNNMRVEFRELYTDRRNLIVILISISSLLKLTYALSRDLFESGPDANGYIPFAIGFAQENFFSPKIEGPPYYPSGYPYLLSLMIRITPEDWFVLAQIMQVAVFSFAAYLLYHLVSYIFSNRVAGLTTFIFCFNPAWAVVNGEAMYETFLVSFLIFSFYAIISPQNASKRNSTMSLVVSGFCASIAVVIHPRVLPLVLFTYFIFLITQIRQVSKVIALIGSTFALPLLFAARNFQAKGSFTLMSSFWDGQTYNNFLNGCTSIACATGRVFSDPLGFLMQCYLNGIRYWSPHSGPLERGTWLHNISLQSVLNSHGYSNFAIILSQILSILVFLSWIYGSVILHRENASYNYLCIVLASMIWITDILVYGENRHRLIALIFMLPAQSACILSLLKKVQPKTS